MRELTYEPTAPETDPRFTPISVVPIIRRKPAAPPETFTCTICDRNKQSGHGGYYQVLEPLPGNLCRACHDRMSRRFGNSRLSNVSSRSDAIILRSLDALATVLKKDIPHGQKHDR